MSEFTPTPHFLKVLLCLLTLAGWQEGARGFFRAQVRAWPGLGPRQVCASARVPLLTHLPTLSTLTPSPVILYLPSDEMAVRKGCSLYLRRARPGGRGLGRLRVGFWLCIPGLGTPQA